MRVIAGCARGRQLKTRKGMETRPTADRVKESLFNILSARISDSCFLDVFAGNGGVGIEALSRGAQKCVFIEKNKDCVRIIKDNLEVTGLMEQGQILAREAVTALSRLEKEGNRFDLIFLDPPYYSPDLETALGVIAGGLLAPEGLVIVEHHSHDKYWLDKTFWYADREKQYGDTKLTFLKPAAAGRMAGLPDEGGDVR